MRPGDGRDAAVGDRRRSASGEPARRRQPDQRGDGAARRGRRAGSRRAAHRACSAAAQVDDDGYCTQCGTKAPSPRDHFEEQPAPWVGGVCDRGIRHHRNEDAMAMAVDGRARVLVVCDGVSNTVDSAHRLAWPPPAPCSTCCARRCPRARRAREPDGGDRAGRSPTPRPPGSAPSSTTVPSDVPNPPSCTLVAAVLEDGVVHYCGLGDCRVYLLPDAGDGQILTVDDSMAQVLIAGGTPRAEAEASSRRTRSPSGSARTAPTSCRGSGRSR